MAVLYSLQPLSSCSRSVLAQAGHPVGLSSSPLQNSSYYRQSNITQDFLLLFMAELVQVCDPPVPVNSMALRTLPAQTETLVVNVLDDE